jgi:hypothetical protein
MQSANWRPGMLMRSSGQKVEVLLAGRHGLDNQLLIAFEDENNRLE